MLDGFTSTILTKNFPLSVLDGLCYVNDIYCQQSSCKKTLSRCWMVGEPRRKIQFRAASSSRMSGGGGGGNPQQLNLFETTSIHFKRETQFPVSKFCFPLNIFCVRVAKFQGSHGNISLRKRPKPGNSAMG